MTDHDQQVPDEVWEQTGPSGGAVDGALPRIAVPTVPQGVTTVREAPALRHNSGKYDLVVSGAPVRIGREPRRRRLLLSVLPASGSPDAYVIAGDNAQQAAGGYGLALPAGTVLDLHTGDGLWFATFGANLTLSWLAELDQG